MSKEKEKDVLSGYNALMHVPEHEVKSLIRDKDGKLKSIKISNSTPYIPGKRIVNQINDKLSVFLKSRGIIYSRADLIEASVREAIAQKRLRERYAKCDEAIQDV